jgi:lysyl-tRNA synthetase class 1
MHWADKIADNLIRRYPDQEAFHCASGISPSGPVHVGNLRDIVTIWFVGKALQERKKKVYLFHSWDDYDRFRKVPKGIPESYAEFVGRPLSQVPDPFGSYESYAARYEHEFAASLRELGLHIAFRYQTQMYQSGVYREGILEAVGARQAIYDIIAGYRTQGGSEEERESYFPVTIYCEACDRDTTEILSTDASETELSYACLSCQQQGVVNLRTATNIKLPWKVDWAMRWRHENVIFEPGGKDHATAGGSFEVSSEIARQIYHYRPPVFQPYEFIGIKGLTGKMSSSSGELLTPGEVLEIYQPEVLLWVFARTPPTRAFDLAVDEQVQRIYEEFDKAKLGSDSATDQRSLELAQIPGREVHPVSFRQLASFSGVVQGNRQALEDIFARIGTPCRQELFAERLQKAGNWLEHYAPDQRVTLCGQQNQDYFQTLAPHERQWVAELYRWLQVSEIGLAEATEKLYAIPKQAGMTEAEQKSAQRRFFEIVYHLLFGRDKGPRLSTFVVAVSPEAYLDLLNFSPPTPAPAGVDHQ